MSSPAITRNYPIRYPMPRTRAYDVKLNAASTQLLFPYLGAIS